MIRALRYTAGLPIIVAAYVLADFGAYDFAYQVRELARRIAGVQNDG